MITRALATVLLACWFPLSAWGLGAPLQFGLFPNLSTRLLLELHQPLADFLALKLKRPVYLETAPDFASFVTRTRQGHYDLLLTAPHLAYLANAEAGYLPLYTYANPIQGMLVVRKDAPFQALKDLHGKTIAFADPLAIVVIMMELELSHADLQAGRDYVRLDAGSHNNAALLVAQGKAQGGVLGVMSYQRLNNEIKSALRPLAFTRPVLSQVYLVNPRLPAADQNTVHAALAEFAGSAPGRAFMENGNLGGLVPVSVKELQEYKSFGEEAARRLDKERP